MAGSNFGWELNLIGYWEVRFNGQSVEVGTRQQRLISALALLGSRSRVFLADLLWPNSSESQAAGNLRASVFRIAHQLPQFMHASPRSLALDPGVNVDVHQVRALIREVETSHDIPRPSDTVEVLSSADILPGWYEDWVIFEQERFAQQRLDALERLAQRCLLLGDTSGAKEAARAAAAIEPLRESAHLLLIQCHLAEGNLAMATRIYHDLTSRLHSELGIMPSRRFVEILGADIPVAALPTAPAHGAVRARAGPRLER